MVMNEGTTTGSPAATVATRAAAVPSVYMFIFAGLPIYALVVFADRPEFVPMVILGMVLGFMIAAAIGFLDGSVVMAALGLFAAFGVLVSGNVGLSAGLLALAAFLGRLAMTRKDSSTLVVPAAVLGTWIFTPMIVAGHSVTAWQNVVAIGVLVGLGGIWGSALGGVLRLKLHVPNVPPGVLRHSLTSGVLLAIVFAVATVVIQQHDLGEGGMWYLLTIVLVYQPFALHPWKKTVHRVFGTVIGVGVAGLFTYVLPSDATTIAYSVAGAALLCVAVHLLLSPNVPYWKYVIFLTAGLMLMIGSEATGEALGESVRHLSMIRLTATLCGVATALAITGITVLGSAMARRDLVSGDRNTTTSGRA